MMVWNRRGHKRNDEEDRKKRHGEIKEMAFDKR